MAATVKLIRPIPSRTQGTVSFSVNEQPSVKFPFINPKDIEYIVLDNCELQHAQDNLGAAKVNKRVVTYFDDEAKRIYFNW